MTKKNILLLLIAFMALGAGWYFMNKTVAPTDVQPDAKTTEVVRANYVATDGSSVSVEYSGQETAILRSDDLGVVRFDRAVSGSGARYVSADGTIVLWNKGDEVALSRNDSDFFVGAIPADSGDTTVLNGSWVWESTDGEIEAVPNKAGAFVLTFGSDSSVSGDTDCNKLGGAFDVAGDGSFSFGPLVSTKMFCEDSQEGEFAEQLRRVTGYAVSEGKLVFVIAGGEAQMHFSRK